MCYPLSNFAWDSPDPEVLWTGSFICEVTKVNHFRSCGDITRYDVLDLNVTFGAAVDDVAGCRLSVEGNGSHETMDSITSHIVSIPRTYLWVDVLES